MSRPIDTVVIGGGTSGLAAAIALARTGAGVVVVEAAPALGGLLREVEFAPGFRAAPLGGDAGWLPREVARGLDLPELQPEDAGPRLAFDGNGGRLELGLDPAATAAAIRRFSARDAERWAGVAGQVHRLAGILGLLYVSPAPRIDVDRIGELFGLLKVGRRLRGLGKAEMVDFLRLVPMAVAETLDERFESDLLKGALAADALTDLAQGPMSGGTTFNLLHRHVGAPLGALGVRPRFEPGRLVAALVDRARSAGVELRPGARVRRIATAGERVAAVELDGGERIECRDVLSSLDPYRTMLELLDPALLDPDFIRAVRNIRFRGAASVVMVALDGLPDGVPERLSGLVVAPSLRFIERSYDDVKFRHPSADPVVEVRFPAGGAPAGRRVAVIESRYTPYRPAPDVPADLGALTGERAIAAVDRVLPGFAGRVLHRAVLTPADLEREFGMREGAASHGEMMLDQILFMRPVAGWSRYATPVPGLYLCGSGTHPGGGVVGASGWLAAQALLQGRKR
ncbi:MAG: phytoene desaturase family protein [Gemmatimonadales bacterium]